MSSHIDGKGARHNETKPMTDLVCPLFILSIANVSTYGATSEYALRNWERGNKWGIPISSLLRHLLAFIAGQDLDPKTGLPHVDHIGFCAQQLHRNYYTYKDGDDRSPALKESPEALEEIYSAVANLTARWASLHKESEKLE